MLILEKKKISRKKKISYMCFNMWTIFLDNDTRLLSRLTGAFTHIFISSL